MTSRMASEQTNLYRIPPYYYLHVLDLNTNVTRIEIGPKTFIRADNEKVVFGPERMITIPPRHYCVIENPVQRDANGEVQKDTHGQVKLLHADLEVRLAQDPFPLYPGETVKVGVSPLRVVAANTALRLKALLDFKDENGVVRVAGDEWLFEGPGTYIPRKEVSIEETVKATVINVQQAIRLRARKECIDRDGQARVTGEEWLVKKVGAYLPGAYEEVVSLVTAYVLTEKTALHLRALRTFKDDFGLTRRSGEEWLITMQQTETHIPHVYEEVVGVVPITTLNSRQYSVVVDPVDDAGRPQLGKRKLVKGEKSFFSMPGERLENGIQDVYILSENEGLVLRAIESFIDETEQDRTKQERRPGDLWMKRGPCEYVPPVEVEVVARRSAIPLDENEGIYVRNIKTGKVRSVTGSTYLLNQDEELWEKDLPAPVEDILSQSRDPLAFRSERNAFSTANAMASKGPVQQYVVPPTQPGNKREKTRVVSYRVPHNAAVQIYDYKQKKARVVFGPELVMLEPDEQFTLLSLSGGKPKQPNTIKSLCLLLGPDFCTDIITVETSDHARLQMQLAYNWHFEVRKRDDPAEAAKLFSVPDFVGDACKAIASRIRGAVAAVGFDEFHKNSARIIRASVFGVEDNKVRDRFNFPQNSLAITNIDIQSIEPVDQRTRDALQKSVQLAIEITTNSQEATARHEAERREQEAKGRLEKQRISDQADVERARKELLEIQAKSEAIAHAEAAKIEAESAVDQARLKADAMKIEAEAELERLQKAREAELKFIGEQNTLEIRKMSESSAIEVDKFKRMVDAVGQDTLKAIALAGPDMQVKLLGSLGLKSTLITDGKSPINLFSTAFGLLGAKPPNAHAYQAGEENDA